mgnify:CR=1 FL=1
MPTAEPCLISLRRLRAVAILKFGTVDALHKRLPLCARAIWAQIQRGRLSPAVHAALLAALGEDAWRFATGQTDTLTDVEGARE